MSEAISKRKGRRRGDTRRSTSSSSSKRGSKAFRSYLDQYPYETFGGGPTGVIPSWGFAAPGTDRSGGLDAPLWRSDGIFANHKENLKKNLADPVSGPLLVADIEHVLDLQGGAARHIIVVFPEEPSLIGKTLAEVAHDSGKSSIETLVDFAMTGTEDAPHGALFRPIAGDRFDVENYMRQVVG